MREPLIWRLIARIVSTGPVRGALVRWAERHPYTTIGPDGAPYMVRGWVFNPYPGHGNYRARIPWLPSIRLHDIRRPDSAKHPHDHPLRSRTIILRGWYFEERPGAYRVVYEDRLTFSRHRGDTYALRPGVDFHHIYEVAERGVLSLFVTWPARSGEGSWGFLVNGERIPHNEYNGREW